jgi:hypothetical protein
MKPFMFGVLCVVAVVFGVAGFCGSASAAILYDNLGATSDGADSVVSWGPIADSFSTGSESFLLGDVKLLLSGDSTSTGTITVDLRSDNSTSPGAVIATIGTLSDSLLSTSASVFDFPVTPITLTANTRYWIQISTDPSTAVWWWSSDTSGIGVAGEFFSNANGVWPNDDGPYQMQVSGNSTVPEPGAIIVWSLLGALGITLGWWRRRKAA